MSAWLDSYRQKHANAETAKTAKTPKVVLEAGRAAYVSSCDMPAGAGVCPDCGEVRWLSAGPTPTTCDECEITRLLAAGARAVGPHDTVVRGDITNHGAAQ